VQDGVYGEVFEFGWCGGGSWLRHWRSCREGPGPQGSLDAVGAR
jgi:hypothetical protein